MVSSTSELSSNFVLPTPTPSPTLLLLYYRVHFCFLQPTDHFLLLARAHSWTWLSSLFPMSPRLTWYFGYSIFLVLLEPANILCVLMFLTLVCLSSQSHLLIISYYLLKCNLLCVAYIPKIHLNWSMSQACLGAHPCNSPLAPQWTHSEQAKISCNWFLKWHARNKNLSLFYGMFTIFINIIFRIALFSWLILFLME